MRKTLDGTGQLGVIHRLWRIDDTLVELSDDGKELHSLVAPA